MSIMKSATSAKKTVRKKTGGKESFAPKKLCESMTMVGASPEIAMQICGIIDDSVDSGISTDQIFSTTRRYLQEFDPNISALYALERGLSALGPSGFVFEQYIASLFREMDYQVTTNVFAEGEGVIHEIDVWAEKGNVVYIIEAKYRNDYKSKTHINQVMYADARLQDIKRQAIKKGDTREFYMWVVTNTRFTDNAIHYVEYRDIQLMGWDYPKYINLKKIVSERKLYPVTILPSVTPSVLKSFSKEGVILVKQLYKTTGVELQKKYGISRTLADKLVSEIAELH